MRSPLSFRRAFAVTAVSAALLLLSTAHAATAVEPLAADGAAVPAATAVADACTVSQASLTWGFKESFRSYISGSIARGSWEPQDGATYATPSFSWATATGTVADDGASAEVAFTGGIHFTGHDGLLDATVANPTIAMDSPMHAVLHLDVSTVPMDAAMAGDTTVHTVTQVPFVDVDLSAASVTTGDGTVTITATDAPTTITAEGFAAFGNYETGTAFDPITLQVTATCPIVESTPTEAAAAPEPSATAMLMSDETDAADMRELSWGLVVAAIAGVVAVAAIIVVIVRTRRRPAAAADAPAADTSASEDGPTSGAQS